MSRVVPTTYHLSLSSYCLTVKRIQPAALVALSEALQAQVDSSSGTWG
jgi:hypothetical protein